MPGPSRSNRNIEPLLDFLHEAGPGPVKALDSLEDALSIAWREFDGWWQEGMDGRKLFRRIEEAEWSPPTLTFVIERHGGMALGSSRAALHRWTLDLDALTADVKRFSYRQVLPRNPRFNVKPVAADIANCIVQHREDMRLKWNKDGSVRVQIAVVVPDDGVPKQTLTGRRKRFRAVLEETLKPQGWVPVRINTYAPSDSATAQQA